MSIGTRALDIVIVAELRIFARWLNRELLHLKSNNIIENTIDFEFHDGLFYIDISNPQPYDPDNFLFLFYHTPNRTMNAEESKEMEIGWIEIIRLTDSRLQLIIGYLDEIVVGVLSKIRDLILSTWEPESIIIDLFVQGRPDEKDLLEPGKEKENNDIEQILKDVRKMKEYYSYYFLETAKEIIEAIPEAWEKHYEKGERWGPGIISTCCGPVAETVGRYLKAFWKAGITEIEIDDEKIPIPYKPRNR